jgi:hypothetical protein
LPSQYLAALRCEQVEQSSKRTFVNSKVQGMTTEFNSRLELWDKQIGSLLSKLKEENQANLTANFVIERQLSFKGS